VTTRRDPQAGHLPSRPQATGRAGAVHIEVDPALAELGYRCYPNGCPRDRTCCVGLAVSVTRREMRVIDSLMDELARLVPTLRQGDGYVDVFGSDGDGMQIEPRDERGTCPFLFATRGRVLCAIHHAALQSGRTVAAVKPRACRHWPLVLEPVRRGLRITIHPDARMIGCVAPVADLPGQPSMREAFASEIAELSRIARG